MPVEGLAGVLVWTSAERFDALRRFYVDVLGLAPRSDREGFVNFEWGAQRLTIHVHDQVSGVSTEPFRVMFNLAVDDIDEVVATAAARGATVVRRPEREIWGGIVATLSDPDGNSVQLFQLPVVADSPESG